MKKIGFICFTLALCFLIPNVSIAEQGLEKTQSTGSTIVNENLFDANSGWSPNVSPDIQMGYVPIERPKIKNNWGCIRLAYVLGYIYADKPL